MRLHLPNEALVPLGFILQLLLATAVALVVEPADEAALSPPLAADSHHVEAHAGGHLFTIFNNCTENIWVATLANPYFPAVANGGFLMARGAPPVPLLVPHGWQGRIWARVGCNFTESGDCDPPYQPCCASGSCLQANGKFGLHCAQSGVAPTSLIELSLDNGSPLGPYDVYDVSLVDGWSVPLSIAPVPGTFNPTPDPGVTSPWCALSGCTAAPACPPELAVNGTSLSCWSPCQAAVNAGASEELTKRLCCVCTLSHPECNCATSNDPYSGLSGCCRGGYGCSPFHTPPYPQSTVCDPWSTLPSRVWPPSALAYIDAVEGACSEVYSWQFDDEASTFQCRRTGGFVDYDVTFVTRFR